MAFRALVAAVEGAGVERSRFLAEARLVPAQLEDANLQLSPADYARVARVALSITGDAALGLHIGEQANTSRFDVLGHLAEHSRTLREALQVSARYGRIVADGPRLELSEDTDAATIRLTLLRGASPGVALVAEFSTTALLYLIRRFVGSAALPRHVFFAYPAPAHHAEYTRVFGGRAQFDHDFTGLELEASWLDREQLCASPELSALLRMRAEALLAQIEHDAPAAERVKRWLGAQKQAIRPTMEATARDLGMSARSLRRRLREERTMYSELVEHAQAEHAKRILADPRHSVQETAYALGFNSPAAFSRAFKRWTGKSPNDYRTARRSGAGFSSSG